MSIVNNKKILIVEDEILMLKALVRVLNQAGFDTLEACNGKEGLKTALLKKPDLILLDIIMPKMDGLTMLRKLQKNKWGSKVPVIFLTNLSDPEKIVAATRSYTKTLSNGMYDYLIKSDWRLTDVVKKVKEKLEML
ncbi:hypothetical protein CL633_03030 [bacterium]|nr:hypothetical protein [bacterium]|tara:strand:- start:7911 stop:8318 length:408 start_codon:yes stop_codon:yes gene_type:complete